MSREDALASPRPPGGRLFRRNPNRESDSSINARFEMPGEAYLRKHHIRFYLEDATRRILEQRSDKPVEAMAAYFQALLCGDHVVGREYAFLKGSPQNRSAFVRYVQRCFFEHDLNLQAPPAGDTSPSKDQPAQPAQKIQITAEDCHALLQLLCTDIPLEVAQDAVQAAQSIAILAAAEAGVSVPESEVPSAWRMDDFLAALQTTFYYGEFLHDARAHVFGPLTLRGSLSHKRCAAQLKGAIRRAAYEAHTVPPDNVLYDALDTTFSTPSLPSHLSCCDAFIGALCRHEGMLAQYREQMLAASESADSVARAAAEAADDDRKPSETLRVADTAGGGHSAVRHLLKKRSSKKSQR